MRLTAKTIEAIEKRKAPDEREEHPDEGCRGLYLIVQPKSKKMSWAIRYRHDGKTRKMTLGPYNPDRLNLVQARLQAIAELNKLAAGTDPAAEAKQVDLQKKQVKSDEAQNDVATVFDLFLARHTRVKNKESTAIEVDRMIKRGVKPAWTGRNIADIGRRDIIALIDGIVDRGSPFAANRMHAMLKKAFGWFVERDILKSSPMTGLKPPTQEQSRDRVLADEELRQILIAADGLGWPFAQFVRVLALTGQRRDEVASIRWSEINFDDGLWVIPGARTKNSKSNAVPLSPQVSAILTGLPRISDGKTKSDLVFTTTGRTPISGFSRAKTMIDAAILKTMKDEAEARGDDPANVKRMLDWRFHDLRRTMASGMARLGVQIHVVEKILNHVSGTFGGIVGVYQRHDFADEKRAALLTWGRHLASLDQDERSKDCSLKVMG